MNEANKVYGIIYPLPKKLADRISNERNILVKYLTHEPTKKSIRLNIGNYLFVYQSKRNKEIIGYAEISDIEQLYFNEILKHYKDKLIPNLEEIIQYSKGRENKKLLVLKLNSFKRFDKPFKINTPITMTGKYLTSSNITELFSNNLEKWRKIFD